MTNEINPVSPQLLAPAGDFEKLRTALHYGADAVYLGSSGFSLRATAENFDEEGLADAIRYVHDRGRRAYVTANIFPHNRDLPLLEAHIDLLDRLGPDGVIVSDPGLFTLFRQRAPGLSLHVSTQANITNRAAARFWEDLGARRLVLARELSLDEIREIRAAVSLELEVFVHGAICLSYSGRCYLSSYLAHRSGNRGLCTNSCRWRYGLVEAKRPGEVLPVFEDDRGGYVLSPRDLCLLPHLDELAGAGVDSFKIEGRTKGLLYVAGVVRTYRAAVDSMKDGKAFLPERKWIRELSAFGHRGTTAGMLHGPMGPGDFAFEDPEKGEPAHELAGIVVEEGGSKRLRLRNRIDPGDRLTCMTPGHPDALFEVRQIEKAAGEVLPYGRNGQTVRTNLPETASPGDLVLGPTAEGDGVAERPDP